MNKTSSFETFMRKQINALYSARKNRTAETYLTTLNRFKDFLDGQDIRFCEMTAGLIEAFERHLLSLGLCRNTTSFYMRVLRAVYNRGVSQGLSRQRSPFRNVYTGVDHTRKRAVPLRVIQALRRLELDDSPSLALARDLFLFSFYTRGMSFIDMAFLRRSDLYDGMLHYCRRKTGQDLYIRWEPCMQEIVDRYPSNRNGFLLPVIITPGKDERQQYKNAMIRTNRGLAVISSMLGLPAPITTYAARHSWASIAYSHNVPVSLISEGMGHDSEKTTRIYLASLSHTRIDRANHRILSLIS